MKVMKMRCRCVTVIRRKVFLFLRRKVRGEQVKARQQGGGTDSGWAATEPDDADALLTAGVFLSDSAGELH